MLKENLNKFKEELCKKENEKTQIANKHLPAILEQEMINWADYIINVISDDIKSKLKFGSTRKKDIRKSNGQTVVKGDLTFACNSYSKKSYEFETEYAIATAIKDTFEVKHDAWGINCIYKDLGFSVCAPYIRLVYVDVKPKFMSNQHQGGYYSQKLLSYLVPKAKDNGLSITVRGRKIKDEGCIHYSLDIKYSITF